LPSTFPVPGPDSVGQAAPPVRARDHAPSNAAIQPLPVLAGERRPFPLRPGVGGAGGRRTADCLDPTPRCGWPAPGLPCPHRFAPNWRGAASVRNFSVDP
jgi:hypothetical protein